jgi:hypothetical protein
MIFELFEPVGYVEAFRRLDQLRADIDRDLPYGLSYGDLYHILDCFHNVGLRGERVFELGGSLPHGFLEDCIKPEAWHSVTSDIYDLDYQYNIFETARPSLKTAKSPCGNYYQSNLGVLDYFNHYTLHASTWQFSRIFSVAAFEHLKLPSIALGQVYAMCQNGAILYSYFTPTWSAPNGHHWSYFPHQLPPYVHIHFSHYEFLEWCERSLCLNIEEAEMHAHQIYKSTRINRLTPIEWIRVFKNMNFKTLVLNEVGKKSLMGLPGLNHSNMLSSLGTLEVCDGYRLIAQKVEQ